MRTIATWVIAVLVVIGFGVGVEAATEPTTLATGTVRGQIIQVGGLARAPERMVDGEVTLRNVSTGATYQALSDRLHGYSIAVPPGTYNIGGVSFDDYSDGNPMAAYAASNTVVVRSGAITTVHLYVQIR